MEEFPKKYIYKNCHESNKQYGTGISSPFIPIDQKINPGIMFSQFYKEAFLVRKNLLGGNYSSENGLGLSSKFYSELNKGKSASKSVINGISKKLKSNISFFNKSGIDVSDGKDKLIMSEEFCRYMRKIFGDLYENKIFTNKEEVLWSIEFQTNCPKQNMIIKEKESKEYSVKYFIESKGTAIYINTRHLETIFADVAVAVNPNDKRYRKIVGQNVIIPIINKSIPVIVDDSVDSFKGNGIRRVTPGHDERSLGIAQKNGLETDIYAIDTDGKFTANAGIFEGKNLDEFYDNIETFIDDIGNLESIRFVNEYEYINSLNMEKLFPITLNQWHIAYDYTLDYLLELFDKNIIKVPDSLKDSVTQILNTKQNVCISNKSVKGHLIPVVYNETGESFVLNDETIVDGYIKQKSKKDITLTLIIINLILNNQLNENFSLEDLIDVLFSNDFVGEYTKIERYLLIYEKESKSNSIFKNGLKKLKSLIENLDKSLEKINILSEALDEGFAINKIGDNYCINYSSIFGLDSNLTLQNKDSFNKTFIDCVGVCFKYGIKKNDDQFNKISNLEKYYLLNQNDLDNLINILLLGVEYGRTLIFSDIVEYPQMVDIKGNTISNFNSKYTTQDLYENLNLYGPDVLRLTLLLGENFQDTENVIFDTCTANYYYHMVNKIWNANRYIFNKYLGNNKIKVKDLMKVAYANLSPCDSRLIHNLKSFLDDIQNSIHNGNILEIGKKIINFYVNILCDKYLQATKVLYDENTPKISMISFAIFSKLVEPYIPDLAKNIQEKLGFDWEDCNLFSLTDCELGERNYKINIMMDIIDKFDELRVRNNIKKHELTDIFVQANSDFIDFLQDNDSLLKNLINIGETNYIGMNSDIPTGYDNASVININLGLKISKEQNTNGAASLMAMEQELAQKKEHIQHIKSILVSAYTACPPEIIEKKKQDIQNLQAEIDELESKIKLLKSKK